MWLAVKVFKEINFLNIQIGSGLVIYSLYLSVTLIQLPTVVVLSVFPMFVSAQKLRSARLVWVKIVPAPKENIVLTWLGVIIWHDAWPHACL